MANHHHDLRSAAAAAAAAAAYPDARANDYLGYCDPAAVNLWRMVVPRGGPAVPDTTTMPPHPPTHATAHQPPPPPPPAAVNMGTAEPPHWGYGPWSSMPAPPITRHHNNHHHNHQGIKRYFNESEDCDDAFSEESSKDR